MIPILEGADPASDDVSRGEYLRIFSEVEDTFKTVYVNRPAAENKNSELDASMLWKRIPAWGVFKQTLHLIGYYMGLNILNHHYVTEPENDDAIETRDEESYAAHRGAHASPARRGGRCAHQQTRQTTRLHRPSRH